MTAVLLALMIARPIPDESARVVGSYITRMKEAYLLLDKDPERAIRLVDELLDDPKAREWEGRSATVRAYRQEAVYLRGHLSLRVGRAVRRRGHDRPAPRGARAIARPRRRPLRRAAARPPRCRSLPPARVPLSRMGLYRALGLRAQAYEALGRHEEERADRAEAAEILREASRSFAADPQEPSNEDPPDGEDEGEWPRTHVVRVVGAWDANRKAQLSLAA